MKRHVDSHEYTNSPVLRSLLITVKADESNPNTDNQLVCDISLLGIDSPEKISIIRSLTTGKGNVVLPLSKQCFNYCIARNCCGSKFLRPKIFANAFNFRNV